MLKQTVSGACIEVHKTLYYTDIITFSQHLHLHSSHRTDFHGSKEEEKEEVQVRVAIALTFKISKDLF